MQQHSDFTGVAQLGGTYVLLLDGEAIAVVNIDGAQLRRGQIADLEHEGHFELASAAPELVRSLARAANESPAVKGPASLIDVDKLLTNLESSAADGDILLARDGEFAVAHLEAGEVTFFSGCGIESPREQLLLFCYETPDTATIVHVVTAPFTPDARTGPTFREWLDPKAPAPAFYVTFSRHGKIIERRLCKEHELRIGRDRDNDVIIDHRSVSRHHVAVVWDGVRYKAKDQGSANGTELNGRRVEMAPLKSGDRLHIGQIEVRFDLVAAAPATALATLWAGDVMALAPKARLVRKGRSIALDRPVMTIGASPSSDIRVNGWLVRPTQATIVLENGRYYLSNAGGGLRQVRIGAEKIYAGGAVLQDGDEIVVAGERMSFTESTLRQALE